MSEKERVCVCERERESGVISRYLFIHRTKTHGKALLSRYSLKMKKKRNELANIPTLAM